MARGSASEMTFFCIIEGTLQEIHYSSRTRTISRFITDFIADSYKIITIVITNSKRSFPGFGQFGNLRLKRSVGTIKFTLN